MLDRIRRARAAPGLVLTLVLFLSIGAGSAWAQSEPTVALTMPNAGQTIVEEAEIRGTAGGPGFSRYDLHYRPVGVESEFIYFGGGENPVEAGSLGTWSSLNLDPGDYEIRLTAHFTAQQAIETRVRFALANSANVGELENVGGSGPGSLAGPDSELRDALDRLVARARPEILWVYLERGAQISITIGGVTLAYFVLKTLLAWLLRRARR